MDLDLDSHSRGQVMVLMAVVISIAVISGTVINLEQKNVRESTPDVINNEEPKATEIAADFKIGVIHILQTNNVESGANRNIVAQITELEQRFSNQYRGADVSVDIATPTSNIQNSSKVRTDSNVEFAGDDSLMGGFRFNRSEMADGETITTDIDSPSGDYYDLEITRNDSEPNGLDIDVSGGSITDRSFTMRGLSKNNTVDIGSGLINQHSIVNSRHNDIETIEINNAPVELDWLIFTKDDLSVNNLGGATLIDAEEEYAGVEYTITINTEDSSTTIEENVYVGGI